MLAPTRWKLRKVVALVNQTLAELCVVQHPDKTFVGRISRGFSFLGYEFNAVGLVRVAEPTRNNFGGRIKQLYEQGASRERIADYVRRWLIWVKSGLNRQMMGALLVPVLDYREQQFGSPSLVFANPTSSNPADQNRCNNQ